jgi:gluconolactonase
MFFSDPPYGLKDQRLIPGKYQPVAGIYYRKDGVIKLLCDQYQYPNGVCLSPDKKTLFTCSNKEFERFVLMFDAETFQPKGIFCNENGDGIKCDKHGNVYLCTREGILILDDYGKRSALLELPTIAANICWGGKDQKDMFITARQNIFLIRNFMK